MDLPLSNRGRERRQALDHAPMGSRVEALEPGPGSRPVGHQRERHRRGPLRDLHAAVMREPADGEIVQRQPQLHPGGGYDVVVGVPEIERHQHRPGAGRIGVEPDPRDRDARILIDPHACRRAGQHRDQPRHGVRSLDETSDHADLNPWPAERGGLRCRRLRRPIQRAPATRRSGSGGPPGGGGGAQRPPLPHRAARRFPALHRRKRGRHPRRQGRRVAADPFSRPEYRVSNGAEQGLLGLAFDPAYAANGRFIVHYTDASGSTTVSAYRVSAADPDQADPTSEAVLLTVAQPFPNHNGGQIAFGPDGMLYIGLGDGGGGGDPAGRGQSLADLLGDILRVDVGSGTGYTVPADNPFVGQAGAQPEVWSYGLRNPWRFSFDAATGDLYIADVGENAWEEVDVVTAAAGAGRGTNFGWKVMEGRHCSAGSSCDPGQFTLPVLEYSHASGCSITGG